MALFKKKRDHISERAKSLNQQIASLQAEIERLSVASVGGDDGSAASEPIAAAAASAQPATGSPKPRLRSTAFPKKVRPAQSWKALRANRPSDPVFEEVSQNGTKDSPEPANPAPASDLGVRKYDLPSLWRRWTNQFRGPATSNPKLVNYLAAGSIQGLRPLRYEKRVARNRFILLVVVLILALWGLIAMFWKRS